MQMDICDPQVWRRSLLPRVFDYIVEGNRLLHATMEVLGERHVRYLNEVGIAARCALHCSRH